MDDFGPGYSSLSCLQSFPFDKNKIDKSLVHQIESSPQALSIMKTIIGLGLCLAIRITAEGVESFKSSRRRDAYSFRAISLAGHNVQIRGYADISGLIICLKRSHSRHD
ncbi:EAL domain-containing protein [Pseudomonas luteola]|uniref:EAL domain-containing protein n=1 Tax=Pseudomonas luteola TaxID=47886 RepID=UPI003DA0BB94